MKAACFESLNVFEAVDDTAANLEEARPLAQGPGPALIIVKTRDLLRQTTLAMWSARGLKGQQLRRTALKLKFTPTTCGERCKRE